MDTDCKEDRHILFIVHPTHHPPTLGLNAASLSTAQSYIEAFQQLAKRNNTLILPANAGDVTGVVGSAVTMYNALAKTMHANAQHTPEIGDGDGGGDAQERLSDMPSAPSSSSSQTSS